MYNDLYFVYLIIIYVCTYFLLNRFWCIDCFDKDCSLFVGFVVKPHTPHKQKKKTRVCKKLRNFATMNCKRTDHIRQSTILFKETFECFYLSFVVIQFTATHSQISQQSQSIHYNVQKQLNNHIIVILIIH